MTDKCEKTSKVNDSSSEPVLKQIFDKYAEENISDERVRLILRPILRMIHEGRFDKPIRERIERIGAMVLSAAAVIVITLVIVITQRANNSKNVIIVPNTNTPLASMSNIGNVLSGQVQSESIDVEGIELQLIDTSNMEVIKYVTTDINGYYSFERFPDGIYTIKIILPEGTFLKEVYSEENTEINDSTKFNFKDSENTKIEGVNLTVWEIN